MLMSNQAFKDLPEERPSIHEGKYIGYDYDQGVGAPPPPPPPPTLGAGNHDKEKAAIPYQPPSGQQFPTHDPKQPLIAFPPPDGHPGGLVGLLPVPPPPPPPPPPHLQPPPQHPLPPLPPQAVFNISGPIIIAQGGSAKDSQSLADTLMKALGGAIMIK